MKFKVRLDSSSVEELATHIETVIEAMIPEIAEAARNKIITLANERLHSSNQVYVDAVSHVEYPYIRGKMPKHRVFTAAVITLSGGFPVMIEMGWDGGSMKEGLLNGPKARTAKDGTRYNVIPFRHGTPGTTGKNFKAMGSQFVKALGRHEAARLGERVYAEAKALKPRERLRPRAGGTPILRSTHETDLYSSMEKIGSSQYMTWRTVSSMSHPDSWVHPGLAPAKFFDEAARHASAVAPIMLKEALGGD